MLGLIHVIFAVLSLSLGFVVVVRRKGTLVHRRLGLLYAFSMVGLNGTALMIYRLFGGFGPFHVAAIISLVSVLAGFTHVYRRRPRRTWVIHHAYWMSWSYVGLLAAATAEVLTRVPGSPFWWMVFLATFAVVGIGAGVINTRVPKILRSFGVV